ncbi:hypothetical protein [Lacticaseibacillus brantae]|uniref:hypothetical protein n=1 Tax=Lacticaseibacillus brantae TaxID=943673 RepID=UPI00070D744A|nr:hypothetical protein [Lacticaseibacillus brantae]
MKKFITLGVVIASLGLTAISVTDNFTNNVQAYGYTTQQTTHNWYATGQWVSAWFTLHGTGYSYPNSGSVTSKWITSGAALGHSVTNQSTWTTATPKGTHLYGSATNFYGLDTSWLKIPLKSDTVTLGLQF